MVAYYSLNEDGTVTTDNKTYGNGATITTAGGNSITTGKEEGESSPSLRAPDYVSFNLSIAIPTPWTGNYIGWNATASIDRYGKVYFSPLGISIGKSAFQASGSITRIG